MPMLEKIQVWTINQQPKCTWNNFFRSFIFKEESEIFNFPSFTYNKDDLEEISSLASKARDKIEQLLASKHDYDEDLDEQGILRDTLDLTEYQNFTGYDYDQPTINSKNKSFLSGLFPNPVIYILVNVLLSVILSYLIYETCKKLFD